MNFPLVYVLILNWKTAQDTITCVKSVQKSDYPNYRILIIDNGSADNSEKILHEYFPNVELIQTGKNLGYAGGNNAGIQYAFRQHADFVWILNPDVSIEPASLTRMMDVASYDPSIGIVGPRIRYSDGQMIDGGTACPEKGYKGKGNEAVDMEFKGRKGIRAVDYVIGCSILIRMKVFEDIGLMIKEFFMYREEYEFNLRAADHGWRAVVCQTTINHHQASPHFEISKYYMTRNTILLARLRRQYLIEALKSVRGSFFEYVGRLFREGHFRTLALYLKDHLGAVMKPVVAGLFMPLPKMERLK